MTKTLWAPWRLEYIEQAGERDADRCVLCEPEPELLLHMGEQALVVLNKYPYASAHLMVAPRRHVGDYRELTEAEGLELHTLTVRALSALAAAFGPQGFNVGWNLGRVGGAAIAEHVHEHIVPRWTGDTNFMPMLADTRVIPQALADTAERLRAVWA